MAVALMFVGHALGFGGIIRRETRRRMVGEKIYFPFNSHPMHLLLYWSEDLMLKFDPTLEDYTQYPPHPSPSPDPDDCQPMSREKILAEICQAPESRLRDVLEDMDVPLFDVNDTHTLYDIAAIVLDSQLLHVGLVDANASYSDWDDTSYWVPNS